MRARSVERIGIVSPKFIFVTGCFVIGAQARKK
jgi:hypothetical protein